MERKRFFLRTLLLFALCVPWVTQAQTAKVSEYDYSVDTAQAYTSIVATGTVWSATDATNGYTSFTMPFSVYLGESQLLSGTTVYVSRNGYVSTTQPSGTTMPGDLIAPLYYSGGFTGGSVYTKVDASGAIVEWRKVKSGINTYSFQLKVLPNGNIKFCYGPMTLNTSISAFVGMSTSTIDVFAATGTDWNTITRAFTQASTRSISSNYHPNYSPYTNTGVVYTFTQPACVKPTGLTVGTLTSTTADLSWTSNGTSFDVKYSTDANFNPAIEGTLVSATDTFATLTGLIPATTYYACVSKVCSATSVSGWSSPVSFTTFCGSVDLPYSENFESYTINGTSTYPTCWSRLSTQGNFPYVISQNSTKSIKFAGAAAVATPLPSLDLHQLSVSFKLYKEGSSSGSIQVGYVSNPTSLSDFELVQTCTPSAGTWTSYEIDFSNISYNGSGYIVFKQVSTATYWYYWLDDVKIYATPSCRVPVNVSVTGNTVSWSDTRNSGAQWQVKYGPTGFDVVTEGTLSDPISTTSYEIPGLASNTDYDVYVRAYCSSTDQSEWTDVVNFVTPCLPRAITMDNPFFEGFEDGEYVNGSAIAGCWSQVSIVGNNTWVANSTNSDYNRTPRTGSYNATLRYSNTDWLFYHVALTAGTQYSFSMYARQDGSSTTTTSIMVAYGTTATDAGMVDTIVSQTPIINGNYQLISGLFTPMTTGEYYVGIRGAMNSAPYYISIDDITLSCAPTCFTPISVAASAITNESATITWTDPNTNPMGWEVKCVPTGSGVNAEGITTVATTDSIVVTGLTAGTVYDVYVRANCTTTDQSRWSDAITFTTLACDINDMCKYAVSLVDSYGDGWNSASLEIVQQGVSVSTITLASGSIGTDSVALCPNKSISLIWHDVNNYAEESFSLIAPYGTVIYSATAPISSGMLTTFNSRCTAPSCFTPTNFTATNTLGTSAILTWQETSPTPATQWEVKYDTTGFDVETGGTSIIVNTNPNTTITGLTPLTSYDFYVRALCSAVDNSEWSSPLTVIPNTFTMNTERDTIIMCGGIVYDNGGVLGNYVNNIADTLIIYPASADTYVTLAGTYSTENNYDKISVYSGVGVGGTCLVNKVSGNGTINVTSTDVNTGAVTLVFTSDVSAVYSGFAFNITCTPMPSCIVPTNLGVTSSDATTATLTWDANRAANWTVRYGLESDFNMDDPRTYTDQTVTTNSYMLTGLLHSTDYVWQVRANCGTEQTNWSSQATFITGCGAWTTDRMPLTENFDGVTGNTNTTVAYHVLPQCWNYMNAGTGSYSGYPSVYASATYSNSGINSIKFYTYTTDTYADQYAIMPEISSTVAMNTLDVSFYGSRSTTTANVIIGVMTNPSDVATFDSITTVPLTTTTYAQKVVRLMDYSGNGRYIAFKAAKPTSGYNGFYLDDIKVEPHVIVNVVKANDDSTVTICNEIVMMDTINGGVVNNANATWVITPATIGKVVNITGSIDCEYGYDYVAIYEGVGTTGTRLYYGTGSDNNIDITSPNNVETLTVQFISDADGNEGYNGFRFHVKCVCPPLVDTTALVVEACGHYTWKNGRVYDNVSTVPNAATMPYTNTFAHLNTVQCVDTFYNLALSVHPIYSFPIENQNVCAGLTFNLHGTPHTETGVYADTLHTIYGCDSVFHVSLTKRALPIVAIHVNGVAATTTTACNLNDLTLRARGAANTTFTYLWEDASTNEYRTVQPENGSTYSVRTINAYGCESTPATLAVTTVASPLVSLVAANPTLCAGDTTTLTATANDNWAYTWTNATAATSQVVINPETTTTYTVTATSTDAMHCYGSAQVTVNVNALPLATITATPATLCQGGSTTVAVNTNAVGANYLWNNASTAATLTDSPMASTDYTVTVADANNCHKDYTAHVVVNRVYDTTDEEVTCVMQLPYVWTLENSLTAAGTYHHSFTSSKGCDSTVTLTLFVQDTAIHNSSVSYCFGTPFIFGGQNYTADTSQTYQYRATEDGCPNKYNLAVIVHLQNATTQTEVVCDSMRWNDNLYTSTGIYVDSLYNIYHCDSVATLDLTVNSTKYTEETIAAVCDSMVWNGISYKTAGDYIQLLQTAVGCDSIVTRHLLAVNHSQYDTSTFVTCERTFTWGDGTTTGNGQTYAYSETDGNIAWQKGTTLEDCPLYDVLNLTIKPAPDTTMMTVTACDNYIVDTISCDGTPGLKQYTATGVYNYRTLNSVGNAAIIHLDLTVNRSHYHTTVATVCENTPYSYEWNVNGVVLGTYNSSQLISNAVPNVATGCSDIEVLNLTVLHNDTVTAIAADPYCYTNYYSYTFNGNDYLIDLTADSSATEQVTNTFFVDNQIGAAANGCNKIDLLTLTINPVIFEGYEPIAVCEGTTTIPDWHGTDLDIATLTDGQYTKNIPNVTTTCDHYYGFDLKVNAPTRVVENITADYEYTWRDGVTYQTSNDTAIYTVTGADTNGCDSIYSLNLTLRDTVVNYVDTVDCNQVVFRGVIYRENTTVRVENGIINNPADPNNGLLSVTYYNIIVNTTHFVDQYVTASNSYTWSTTINGNGQTYTASVNPAYNRLAGDCPDVMVLHLTMVPPTQICSDQFPYTSAAGNVIASAMVGTYTYEYVSNANPYTLEVLTLNVKPVFNRVIEACPYELPLTYKGTTFTADDTNHVTEIRFSSTAGCDSVNLVTLNVGAQPVVTYVDTMCGAGDTPYTYTGYGFIKNSGIVAGANSFMHRVAAPSGCDSNVTLNLFVDMPMITNINDTQCYTYTSVNGISRTNDTNIAVLYNDTLVVPSNGKTCNDTTIFHVTLNPRTINNITYISNTGILEYNGIQYTSISATEPYIHTFDSILAGTNSFGCDSIEVVTIKVGHPVIIAFNEVACGSYEWIYGNDTTILTTTGTYYDTISSVEGFDSIMVLNLTVNAEVHTTDTITFPVSEGILSYGGSTFNYSGYLKDTTEIHTIFFGVSTVYCDSLVDLTVNVAYDYRFDTNIICNSQTTYDWNLTADSTKTITIPGPIDYDHVQNFDFADTLNAGTPNEWVYNLHLVRSPFKYGTENIVACKAYTWSNGITYNRSTSTPVRRVTSVAGCDSIVTLNLRINPITKTDSLVVCDTYSWRDGLTYTASTYTATLPSTITYWDAAIGTDVCDTLYTLKLTVKNHQEVTLPTVNRCYNYTWNMADWNGYNADSNTYSISGLYVDTVMGENGCDSILTLPLNINPLQETTTTVAATYSYDWEVADWDGSNTQTRTDTISGSYTATVESITGCDSVITLDLTVYHPIYIDTSIIFCDLPGTPYTWNKTGRTSYGVINDPTAVADTAVISHNVIGGDGVVERLHIYYASTTYDIDRIAPICKGETYTWVRNGVTIGQYTASTNSATYVSPNVAGCDSIVYLSLAVKDTFSAIDTLNVCESAMPYTYTSADGTMSHVFTAAGLYTFENSSIYGCDSNYTVIINVIPTVYRNITDDFCVGTYNFNTNNPAGYYNTYTSGSDVSNFYFPANELQGSGVYTQTDTILTSVATGCEIYTTLNLTVNAPTYDNITKVSCEPYVWDLEGVEIGTYSRDTVVTVLSTNFDTNGCPHYVTLNFRRDVFNETTENITACVSYTTPNGAVCTASGIFTDTIIGQNGACDTYIHYNVTINPITETSSSIIACDNYTWNNRIYNTSGVYIHDTTNAYGCSQTDTLHLTVNRSTTTTETDTVCDSYTWAKNGSLYTASGDYIAISVNASGCQQTDTLHLTVNHSTTTTIDMAACDSYIWDVTGETYTTTGTHTHTSTDANGCDNIATLNLTIYASTTGQVSASNCGPYTWNGTTYNQSGTYTHSFPGPIEGCDSVATLVLTVNQSTSSIDVATACSSYTWDGTVYTHSGIYHDTITNVSGCDSVMTLALTISVPTTSDVYQTACNSYTWLGASYNTSGNYTHTYTDANNCDSIVTLHLTVNNSTMGTANVVACDSYTWVNGITYTASTATPTYTYTNIAGCDSVVTLHLTVNQSTNVTNTVTVCETYTWHGTIYTASTTGATYSYLNAAGCPSTETLNLTVNHGTHNVITATACDSYAWHGINYTSSIDSALYNYTNVANCASVDTLHLTVNHSTTSNANVTACDSYTWINGQTYTTSTATPTYTFHNGNVDGCDSMITLHLTVNYRTIGNEDVTACDSYTWQGISYNISGVHTAILTNAAGCDSVTTLNLTINYSTTGSFSDQASGSYTWNGNTYTTSGTYVSTLTNAAGCDSVVTLHLVVTDDPLPQIVSYNDKVLMINHYPNGEGTEIINYAGYQWYKDGVPINNASLDAYSEANNALLNGCYYVKVPVSAGSTDSLVSNTLCFEHNGINNVTADVTITLSPNPVISGSSVCIETSLDKAELQGAIVMMYDLRGRVVMKQPIEESRTMIHVDQASGAYMVRIITKSGDTYVKKLIIK